MSHGELQGPVYPCISEWGNLFFSRRRRNTRCLSDWSSDVCSSDLHSMAAFPEAIEPPVLGADDDAAGGDGGGGGKRGAGFEIPELLAGGEIEYVEVAVVGTCENAI